MIEAQHLTKRYGTTVAVDIATQAAVTVHRSAGLLPPDTAIVVLAVYAAITLGAASLRVAYRDA
jgi:hypothetical protein